MAAYQSGSSNTISVYWTEPGNDGYTGTLGSGSQFAIQYSSGDPSVVAWSTANAQVIQSTSGVTPEHRGLIQRHHLDQRFLFIHSLDERPQRQLVGAVLDGGGLQQSVLVPDLGQRRGSPRWPSIKAAMNISFM